MNMAKTSGLIAAGLLAGTSAASAALIDFTDSTVGAGPGTAFGGYTVTGNPVAPNTNEGGPGAVALSNGGSLAGDNDGLGIRDDEITGPSETTPAENVQFITVTFTQDVRLTGAYFLDLFVNDEAAADEQEEVHISVGSAIDAVFTGVAYTAARPGLGEFTDLNLLGSAFTFSVSGLSADNDGVANPDAALAAIEVSPVPLPASVLMLGAALGGLGALGRRRRKS